MKVDEQILCSISDAAKLLGIGKSKFYGMLSSGQIGPSPVLLGGKKMFAPDELRFWACSGCPNRENWQVIKDAENG